MPGPRLARNRPTGVSSPSAESSSTRLSPTRSDAASTPWFSTVARCSSRPPNRRSYVSTAASRSSTATPRWWIPRGSIGAMLSGGDGVPRLEDPVDEPVRARLVRRHEAVAVDVAHHLLHVLARVERDDLG